MTGSGRFGRSIYKLACGAALMLGSTAVALIGLEEGLRVLEGQPLLPTVNYVDIELNAVFKPNGVGVRYDEQLGWVHSPNQSSGGNGLFYTFGDEGIRMSSHQMTPVQPGGILLVGDSFGAGSEVDDTESWPAQLERKVGTRVLNAAVGGYGMDQMVLRAEDLIPRYKPKMLIVQSNLAYSISSNRMSTAGGAPKPYFVVEGGKLKLMNSPVPHGVSKTVNIGLARSILGYSYLVQYTMTRLNLLQWWVGAVLQTNYALTKEQSVEVTCLLMRRLGEIRDRYDIPVALVFQHGGPDTLEPTLGYWEADRVTITHCAEQEHLPVVDVHQALHAVFQDEGKAAYQQLWVMHDDGHVYGHMSARGNEMVASLVYRQLFSSEVSEAKPQRAEQ